MRIWAFSSFYWPIVLCQLHCWSDLAVDEFAILKVDFRPVKSWNSLTLFVAWLWSNLFKTQLTVRATKLRAMKFSLIWNDYKSNEECLYEKLCTNAVLTTVKCFSLAVLWVSRLFISNCFRSPCDQDLFLFVDFPCAHSSPYCSQAQQNKMCTILQWKLC